MARLNAGWGGRADTWAFLSLSAALFLCNPFIVSMGRVWTLGPIPIGSRAFTFTIPSMYVWALAVFVWCLLGGWWVGFRY